MDSSIQLKKLKESRARSFWIVVYFLMMAGIIAGLYYSTLKIEYIWGWNRIPGYFLSNDLVEIKSEMKGDVSEIRAKGKESVIVVKDGDTTESYTVPTKGITVATGDFVYAGDPLAAYKEWRVGILILGLWITLKVSVIAIFIGVIIGLFAGLARVSSNPALKWSAITYIELIRGSPLLVQIFIWHYALGTMITGLLDKMGYTGEISPLVFGIAALAFFTGAYVAEMVRAGIQSIHRGQTEASRSLGMTYLQSMLHVILPQAMRRILPPLAGQFISLIKDSSLLGIIAIRELTKATREGVTASLQVFELWFVCAILYLLLTFALSMLVQYLERRAATQ